MATDIKEAIRRLIYEFVTEGADDVIKAQEQIAATTTTTDKAALSLEKAFGGLERRYIETVRHQQDYAKVQDKVNAAVAQNPALQERANAVLAAAAEHFDKLAFNAGKGGAASSFLSKAISTIIGPAGLLGVAITAVGTAVGYMAAQFQSASSTVEENLKEQERLLKEIKTQIDGKASAEAKAAAQSVGLSRYQDLQNEKKLRDDLNKSMERTLALAQQQATAPTQVGGEMGAAPTGTAPLAGFEKLQPIIERLNAAFAAGLPGMTAFRNELAAVATANPALQETVNQLLRVGESGAAIEMSNLQMQAMRDHLAGIATDAQMAAAGLGSLAQVQLNSAMAQQTADAVRRQAEATLLIAQQYPGMSIEVAKQLNSLQQQLPVIQARTGAERMAAQEIATQNRLLAEGRTAEDAMAQAAAEHANAEAQVNAQIDAQIRALQQAIELIEARKKGTEASVKAEQAYTNAIEAGASAQKARQLQEATGTAEGAKAAEQQSKAVEQQVNTTNQVANNTQQIASNQNAAVASANAWNIQLDQAYGTWLALEEKIGFSAAHSAGMVLTATGWVAAISQAHVKTWERPSGIITQFNPEGYGSTPPEVMRQLVGGWAKFGEGGFTYVPSQAGGGDIVPNMQGITNVIDKSLGKGSPIQGAISMALGFGDAGLSLAQQLIGVLPEEDEKSGIEQVLAFVRGQPRTIASETLIKQLTDQLKGLTSSTDALNSTMQNALSPYYSQDPRTTKLGFRAGVVGNPDWLTGATNATALDAILGKGATAPGMAGGGSFIVGGGYSASDNRIAQFPVASGEQVVVNRRPGGSQPTVVHNDNRIIIQGSVDQDTLSRMKISRYQQSQRMRSSMSAA